MKLKSEIMINFRYQGYDSLSPLKALKKDFKEWKKKYYSVLSITISIAENYEHIILFKELSLYISENCKSKGKLSIFFNL